MGTRAHHTKAIATLSHFAKFGKVMNRNNSLKNVCTLDLAQRTCLGTAILLLLAVSKGIKMFEPGDFKQGKHHKWFFSISSLIKRYFGRSRNGISCLAPLQCYFQGGMWGSQLRWRGNYSSGLEPHNTKAVSVNQSSYLNKAWEVFYPLFPEWELYMEAPCSELTMSRSFCWQICGLPNESSSSSSKLLLGVNIWVLYNLFSG